METENQIKHEGLLELTKKAFEKEEVPEFLSGKKGYVCPAGQNFPTDFERIVRQGIFPLYKEKHEKSIIHLLKEALLLLIQGNAVQIWITYRICWELKKSEYEGSSPFTISDDSFWNTVMNTVLEKEESLRSCRKWRGRKLKKGLWGDILKQDKYFEDEYNARILKVPRWSYSGTSHEQIFNLTKKAYERDELPELLYGEIGYICKTDRFFPADIPTDYHNIVRFGIFKIYKETQNKKIVTAFKKALLKLIQGDAVQIWAAYDICLFLKKDEECAPFIISDPLFWNAIREAVFKNEEALRACHKWVGKGDGGLWADICHADKIFLKEYGAAVLKENTKGKALASEARGKSCKNR